MDLEQILAGKKTQIQFQSLHSEQRKKTWFQIVAMATLLNVILSNGKKDSALNTCVRKDSTRLLYSALYLLADILVPLKKKKKKKENPTMEQKRCSVPHLTDDAK